MHRKIDRFATNMPAKITIQSWKKGYFIFLIFECSAITRDWRHQTVNQNSHIEKGHTTQYKKRTKGQTTIYKTLCIKLKIE
jgi:hypothetical protein